MYDRLFISVGFCMGRVTSSFKLSYVEHKHFIHIVSLSRYYYYPHLTDEVSKAQSLRTDRGCLICPTPLIHSELPVPSVT